MLSKKGQWTIHSIRSCLPICWDLSHFCWSLRHQDSQMSVGELSHLSLLIGTKLQSIFKQHFSSRYTGLVKLTSYYPATETKRDPSQWIYLALFMALGQGWPLQWFSSIVLVAECEQRDSQEWRQSWDKNQTWNSSHGSTTISFLF